MLGVESDTAPLDFTPSVVFQKIQHKSNALVRPHAVVTTILHDRLFFAKCNNTIGVFKQIIIILLNKFKKKKKLYKVPFCSIEQSRNSNPWPCFCR